MNWPDSISDALPPERDDEPANLRGDIADELADHLASAMSQELSRTGDEEAARRKVLERFGDPGQLARRLWWDSMGAKIMGQRILVGAVCVMALASLAACALVWQSLRENSRINQAILARLETPATASVYDAPVSLEIECAKEANPKEAVVGYKVSLSGPVINPGENVYIDQVTDQSGVARFGPLRPGKYEVKLRGEERLDLPWWRSYQQSLVLLPGRNQRERILFPAPPPTADLSFEIEWSKPRAENYAGLVLEFEPFEFDGRNSHWQTSNLLDNIVLNESGKVLTGFPRDLINGQYIGQYRYKATDIKESTSLRYLVGSFTLKRGAVIESKVDRDNTQYLIGTIVAQTSFHSTQANPLFEVIEGKPNRWTIKLPSFDGDKWARFEPTAE